MRGATGAGEAREARALWLRTHLATWTPRVRSIGLDRSTKLSNIANRRVSHLLCLHTTLRLLGAGSVLKQAIAELKGLQAEAPERTLALPLLLRLRLTVPRDPTEQTTDDQEFLMDTQDIVETWRREAIQEGVEQGLKQGLEQGVKQGVAHL